MPHLFDEAALEQQTPLRNHLHRFTSSASTSSRSSSHFDETDYDAIVAGDLVGFRMPNSVDKHNTKGDPSMVVAIVLTDDEVVIAEERRLEADPGTALPVWITSPTFCGDTACLFRYVSEEELFVVDRPVDVNSIVVHRDNLSMGVVCATSVDYDGLVLSDVFKYHRNQRFSAEQGRLAHALSAKVKQRPVCTQPWFHALMQHQRGINTQCRRRGGMGKFFVRANPFYAGQLVRSKIPCVDPPREEDNVGPSPYDVASSTPNAIAPTVPQSSLSNHADGIPAVGLNAPPKVHFFGHISSVTFTALVELFLPNAPEESQGDSSLEYVVLIPPSIIESSMEARNEDRKVLFRHVRNVIQAAEHRFFRGERDSPEDDEEPTVAPSHLDAVSPLMYAEYISLETLQNDVQWVRGSCESYIAELRRRQATIRRPHQQQRPLRGRNNKKANTDAQHRSSSTDASLFGNGIVLFGFPELITALDADSGLPMDFTAGELIPVETCGNDNVIVGQHGFSFEAEDPLFEQATEAYAQHVAVMGSEASTTRVPDDGSTTLPDAPSSSAPVMLPTNHLYQWYVDHGILPCDAGACDWSARLPHLYSVLDRLVLITHSFSTLTVRCRETGDVSHQSSAMFQLVPERSEALVRDLFPLDIVVPSDFYAADKLLVHTVGASADGEDANLVARVVLRDAACPVLDMRCVYDYGTDLQVGESVQIRRLSEKFYVEGEELQEDPKFLGIISCVNLKDETCEVTWVRQPLLDMERVHAVRFGDVGQILELLSNTLVRVLWSAGDLEDLPRAALAPLRGAAEGNEDDEEGTEFDNDEDDATWTNDGATPGELESDALSSAEAIPENTDDAPVGQWFSRLRDGFSRLAARLRETKPQPDEPKGDELDNAVGQGNRQNNARIDDPPAAEQEAVAGSVATCDEAPAPHSSFESVSMFSAHLFMTEDAPARNPTIFHKRVQREWKDVTTRVQAYCAAAESAPNTVPPIFVKGCVDVPKLLKFVLVGPLHTPYYQSFLAFDLLYGPEFPIAPPQVRFHSYHMRLNPNLYDDGHICLSLLGTWEGVAQSESWNPAASSVMQIILSIQSLVLVKEPYYNEAGYEDQRGSANARVASKAYNENIALLRIRHLIAMAESPPSDWVFGFRRHFLTVAPQILQRMSKLLDEQSLEDPPSSSGITADGLVLPLSKGFIQAMKRCLAELDKCHARLKVSWAQEEIDVSLPHMA